MMPLSYASFRGHLIPGRVWNIQQALNWKRTHEVAIAKSDLQGAGWNIFRVEEVTSEEVTSVAILWGQGQTQYKATV